MTEYIWPSIAHLRGTFIGYIQSPSAWPANMGNTLQHALVFRTSITILVGLKFMTPSLLRAE